MARLGTRIDGFAHQLQEPSTVRPRKERFGFERGKKNRAVTNVSVKTMEIVGQMPNAD
jgi:hypothetical protein